MHMKRPECIIWSKTQYHLFTIERTRQGGFNIHPANSFYNICGAFEMIMNLFHLVLFLNIPILLANLLDTPIKSVVDLEQHLFPNRSLSGTSTPIYQQGGLRRLDANPTSIPTPSPFSYPCTVCRGLSACSILNGFMVEEVYYPNNLLYLETCKVLESLGKRMEGQIFGTGRTFRDTPQCRCEFISC